MNCPAPSDGNFTFVNWMDLMLRTDPYAAALPQFAPIGEARLATNGWTQVQLDVDLLGGTVTATVHRTHRRTFEVVRPTQSVTTLALTMLGPSTGTEVLVDELMVRDATTPSGRVGGLSPVEAAPADE